LEGLQVSFPVISSAATKEEIAMKPLKKAALFAVSNRHVLADGSGPSPFIDGDAHGDYHSYFENASGDQSIFVHRRGSGETLVYSGDAGWAAFPVKANKVIGLVLSPDEELWVQACLRACNFNR